MFNTWVGVRDANHRLDAMFYRPEYVKNSNQIEQYGHLTTFENLRLKSRPITYGVLKPEFVENGTPLIRNVDFSPPSVDYSAVAHITPLQSAKYSRSVVVSGDLLITIGGYVGTAALVPGKLMGANINQHIARVSLSREDADPGFYWAFIESTKGTMLLERWVSGTVQSGINLEDLRRLSLPHPPINIQHSIGLMVRKIERLRELTLEQEVENARTFYDLTGLPEAPPEINTLFWFVSHTEFDSARAEPEYYCPKYLAGVNKLKALGAKAFSSGLLISAKYGLSVQGNDSADGLTFIRGNDLKDNMILRKQLQRIPSTIKNIPNDCLLNEGDLLVTRSGTVGVSAVVDRILIGSTFGSFMIRLRFNSKTMNPYYVSYFLNSPWGKMQTERERNGAVQENINLDEIGRILIPVPNLAEQNVFGDRIRAYIEDIEEGVQLIAKCKKAVESLIDGTLDEEALFTESAEIEKWLKENPSPYGTSKTEIN